MSHSKIQFDIECSKLQNGNFYPAIVCVQRNNELPVQHVFKEFLEIAQFGDPGTSQKVNRIMTGPDIKTCSGSDILTYLKRHKPGTTIYAYNLPGDLESLAKLTGRDLKVDCYKSTKLGYDVTVTSGHPWYYEEWFWKKIFPEISHFHLFDVYAWIMSGAPYMHQVIPEGPGNGRYSLSNIYRTLFPNERIYDLAHHADYDCKMAKDITEWLGPDVPKSYMSCTHVRTT
jgi:hypothetical protein